MDAGERKFKSLIENAYEGIVLHDRNGIIQYASPSIKNLSGYLEHDVIGKSGVYFIHPEEQSLAIEKFKEVLQTPGKSVMFRQRLQDRRSKYRWFETTLTNLLDQPDVGGIVSNFRDISAQKSVEDELKKSKALVESINHNISEALYRNVPGKEFLYVNQAFLNLFGLSSMEELNRINPKSLYANAQDRNAIRQLLEKENKVTNYEARLRKKNGDTFWGLISSSIWTDAQGNSVHDGAIRDITSEKEAREQLKESEQLLSSINLNIKEGIFRSSFDKIFYINEAFIEMFGYSKQDEVLNISIGDLYYDPHQRQLILNHLRRLSSIRNEEILFRRKDGSTFWGLMSSYAINEDGREFFDGAIRDITDLKRVEDQLISLNQELRAQNKELAAREEELNNALDELSDRNFELDQLVYKTSHDLRSPLTSILGLINIAKKDDSETYRMEYLDKIEQSVLRLDDFVRSMLDYAKTSRVDMKFETLELEELIQQCINDLEFLENYHNVDMAVNVNTRNLSFKSDPLRLKIIFSNIISNAYKYADETKDKSFVKIHVDIKGEGLYINIEDNGIGIGKPHLPKIFDMFYRATEKSEGSGLGMYIVKQSVEKLGGTIQITSSEMVGTQITIFLPPSSGN